MVKFGYGRKKNVLVFAVFGSLLVINPVSAAMMEDCSGTAMEILSCRNKNRVYKSDEAATQHYLQKWENQRQYENAQEEALKAQSEANYQRAEEIKRQKAAEEAYRNSPAGKAEAAKREAAAWGEWSRIMEDNRYWRDLRQKEKGIMLMEQARSRAIIETTLRSYSNKAIPPETYIRLATQAVPNWALTAQIINNAKQEYGGRFELLSTVIETTTCPEHDFIDSHVTNYYCDPKYAANGRKKMMDYLPKASDKDKVLICGYMYASWKSKLYYETEPKYSEERKRAYYADLAIHEKQWQACEAGMGNDPALVRARENFYTAMNTHDLRDGWGIHERGGLFGGGLQQRWFMFVDPHLSTLEDFSDAKKVNAAINTAYALSLVKPWSGKKRREKYTWREVSPWIDDMNAIVDLSPSPNDWLMEWDEWFEQYKNLVSRRDYNDALTNAQKMLMLAQGGQGNQRDERIARSFVAIGEVLNAKQAYGEAEESFKKGMKIFEKITPVSIPQSEIGIFYIHFASVFVSQKKYQESIDTMKKGLVFVEKYFGKEHHIMVSVPQIQGRMHNNLQQYKEAALILRKTYDLSVKLYGVNDNRTKEIKEDLMDALRPLHRDKEMNDLK
ncbi:MAG: hypothetical protein WA080_01210 [Sulfuricurvum sp.]